MPATLKARAGRLNIEIEQGADFAPYPFTWKTGTDEASLLPVDLTGCSAVMQLADPVTGEILLTLDSETGGLTLGDEDGTIAPYIAAEDTAALTFSTANYDVQVTFGVSGQVVRILRGVAVLVPDPTPPVEAAP